MGEIGFWGRGRVLLIANHYTHYYSSDIWNCLWMLSCMRLWGKGINILLDRSFPRLGKGWMSQTGAGWGGVNVGFFGLARPVQYQQKVCSFIHSDNLECKQFTKVA